ETRTLDLPVGGMTCGSCAARVQYRLAKQPGVEDAEVNYATGKARVSLTGHADLEQLADEVDKLGFTLTPPASQPGDGGNVGYEDADTSDRMWRIRMIVTLPL